MSNQNETNKEEYAMNAEMKENITSGEGEDSAEIYEKPVKKWRTGWRKEIIDWVEAIVIAVVVALVLKNFVLTLAFVDGQSMSQTLSHGDRLYVNKLFYTPEKGDIVIIETDKHPQGPLVKRIIATEGDTIYINPSTYEVYLNGKLLEEEYILGDTVLQTKTDSVGNVIRWYAVDDMFNNPEYSMDNPIVVGKGEVFAMGDNRENSKDSRQLGLFKVDEVIGHAVFRFWPLSNITMLD